MSLNHDPAIKTDFAEPQRTGDHAGGAWDMPPVYRPQEEDEKTYRYWLSNGFFHAEVDRDKKSFSIVIPPPNVTGSLHIGHALDETLQDIMVRWRRMQGYNTVWIPGTDHAGIATQVKVEAYLAKSGITRHDLGRERFLEEVWKWKHKYGSEIIRQLQRLGASCDWQRERFTMDEGCSRAVREVFVRLFEKGLIYRGEYIINWCPRCKTSLSDLEVEHEDADGNLYYIKYPFKDGSGHITVATTRPETMLGDVAVAVNPGDDRYRNITGKIVILPIMNREIPVIADEYADPEFGTGAVKVTPGHDPNDFEIGRRHELPIISVIGEDGRMSHDAGKYEGLDRYECREKVIDELRGLGLLERVEPHLHAIGHCQRCDTVVEPLVSKQWFVKMKPLAGPAIKAVQDGRIRFIPERFTKIYLDWMENVHDWCISRQLWWGHRIPAWYCRDCGEVIVSREDPASCSRCGSNIEQDPDVLDTWFSSALWPFSTMGWPDRTPELEKWYPTSLLVTAYDIIFFWVARMIVMGLEFMEEVPFRDVYIHGLVRNPEGKKMSKSLGTGVDPLVVVDEYGADSLRFALVIGNTAGNDMRYRPDKVEGSRNFANKVWNASRFAITNLSPYVDEIAAFSGDEDKAESILEELEPYMLLPDRWIRSRLNQVVKEVTDRLEKYDTGEATRAVYDFIWDEFCDWYLEIVKPRLYDGSKWDEPARRAARLVLLDTLTKSLKLLHPFMPFVTEAIWQKMPWHAGALMVSKWPEWREETDGDSSIEKMQVIMEVTRAIRNIRAEMNIHPAQKVNVALGASSDQAEVLSEGQDIITRLAGVETLAIEPVGQARRKRSISAVAKGVEIFVPVEGVIDIEKEQKRLSGELDEVARALETSRRKLNNRAFVEKAKPEVVEKEKAKYQEYLDMQAKLSRRIAELGGE
ncbi:MAG TPA: valine--tRNA ligase [Firmicutes bacterium]|nr:valine--tRNA ligase [Bacillota bacterium]